MQADLFGDAPGAAWPGKRIPMVPDAGSYEGALYVGGTGTGKSHVLCAAALAAYNAGRRVVVVDPSGRITVGEGHGYQLQTRQPSRWARLWPDGRGRAMGEAEEDSLPGWIVVLPRDATLIDALRLTSAGHPTVIVVDELAAVLGDLSPDELRAVHALVRLHRTAATVRIGDETLTVGPWAIRAVSQRLVDASRTISVAFHQVYLGRGDPRDVAQYVHGMNARKALLSIPRDRLGLAIRPSGAPVALETRYDRSVLVVDHGGGW